MIALLPLISLLMRWCDPKITDKLTHYGSDRLETPPLFSKIKLPLGLNSLLKTLYDTHNTHTPDPSQTDFVNEIQW